MLYLAIDQHKNQLTVNIRNEHGDVIQKGQVSTNHADIDDFFAAFAKKARKHRGYMAIVEVCGFNDWLLEKFKKTRCSEIVVIQPDNSAVNKTDKRDANALGELLWNNRKRLQGGQRPNGIRRIFPADSADAQVRQLANLRQHFVRQRTRVINKIKGIINKHNMAQDAPTQLYGTKKFRQWIATVQLPVVDRFEIDMNIKSWELHDKQIIEIEAELVKRSETKAADVFRLKAIPGISAMGAVILLSRIGDIKRFKNPDSLANYFGLTPGCHNTGGKHRVGGITKRGNAVARHVLNFAVIHLVRKDPAMKAWHRKIKNRRGVKTARVAVMRRLATIIWHILRWGKPYQFRYDPPVTPKKGDLRSPKEVFQGIGNDNSVRRRQGKTPLKCRGKTKT
ncbi:MAG: IS110 family transposase [Planctomycetaceae bacterium]|jgi:transposase|nr:IS110 family transposase [Planctomycetaceae bacterium]